MAAVELRRALLLFAIVLGLAAIVTSVSRTPEEGRDRPSESPPATAVATPRPGAAEPLELRFDQASKRSTRPLEPGRPATVIVAVDEPGQVEIEGLGLSAAAEPLTPARFDVLVSDEGRHPVRFTPAESGESELVGTLDVRPAAAGR